MAHPYTHALSSAKKFGGTPECYLFLHDWFDGTKELEPTFRHRALRHHTHGIFEAERKFGHVIRNSDGVDVPLRVVAEQHMREDFNGKIPTPQDWLQHIPFQPWMQPTSEYTKKFRETLEL